MAAAPRAPWAYLRSRDRSYALEAGQSYPIGRDPERNSLVLDDRSVSGVHAQLRVHADGAALRDLGSRNGCFVNEHRLQASEERLALGDRIRFGFDKATWLVQHPRDEGASLARLAQDASRSAHASVRR